MAADSRDVERRSTTLESGFGGRERKCAILIRILCESDARYYSDLEANGAACCPDLNLHWTASSSFSFGAET